MNTVGIFEAKTKLTVMCEEIARTGLPVMVSKRGRPMVLITPVPAALQSTRPDILTAWQEWSDHEEDSLEEFPEVWNLRSLAKPNPLEQ